MRALKSIDTLANLCDRGWSKQRSEVVLASIINIVDTIWYCHNQARFHNKIVNFHTMVNCIYVSVNITGNILKSTDSSCSHEFQILKAFSIKVHPLMLLKSKKCIGIHQRPTESNATLMGLRSGVQTRLHARVFFEIVLQLLLIVLLRILVLLMLFRLRLLG
jgi:hypothetical protein